MSAFRVDLDVSVRLRRAILQNDVLLVKRIVKNYPQYLRNPDFADRSNTSLHLAAIKGHVEVLKLLLSFGHDSCTPVIDRTGYNSAPGISINTDGSTALHLAAAHGNADCVEILCQTFPHIIDWKNRQGHTALMLAAQGSQAASVSSSTNHPVLPPQARRPRTGSVGTIMASEDVATLNTLLAHNASLTAVDRFGNTALHHASAWGNLKAVRVLLQAGAPPLAPNAADYTPLDYSITIEAAQYFRSLVRDVENQKLGVTTSPQSSRTGGEGSVKGGSPGKASTPGSSVKLVLDTERSREGGSSDDEGAPCTAVRVDQSPVDDRSSATSG